MAGLDTSFSNYNRNLAAAFAACDLNLGVDLAFIESTWEITPT